MALGSVIHALWIGSIWLEAGLVCLLLYRRSWDKFPFFTTYACFSFLEAVLSYAVRKNAGAYFFTYWICEGIGILLGFAVVYEVFRRILAVHGALSRLAVLIFRTAATVLIGLAIAVVVLQSASISRNLMAAVLVTEEAARVIEIGLLMALFLFSSAFGLHWKQTMFGIATGLGLFTAVELITVAMQSQFGPSVANALSVTRILAFDSSLLIWIVYMVMQERVSLAELPKAAQLEQWNQAIMELIHQ